MSDHNKYYNALPVGYVLEQYKIIKILGIGGFGIAYLANDSRLDTDVVIKEYLPNELSVRDQSTIHVIAKDPTSTKDYEWGLQQYVIEARTIAKFNHPNIVQVFNYIEANNTAYIVMNYVQGQNLSELAQGETATEEEIYSIVLPLLDGLKMVHKKGYLHRDIKPSNIFIQDESNNPVLIDFGAARQLLGTKSKSVTTIVTPGYSPYEQYYTRGKQGPWTDIYALGGVMYRLISGKTPEEAVSRLTETMDGDPDPLPSAIEIGKDNYSASLLKAIDHALELREKNRPQSIEKWIKEIKSEEIIKNHRPSSKEKNQQVNNKKQTYSSSKNTETKGKSKTKKVDEAKIKDSFNEDFMSIHEFSKIKGIQEKKVIQMIRDGFYIGQVRKGDWYVNKKEVNKKELSTENKKVFDSERNKFIKKEYISIDDFSEYKGLTQEEIIKRIRDGFYQGRLIDGKWCVSSSEVASNDQFSSSGGYFSNLIKKYRWPK